MTRFRYLEKQGRKYRIASDPKGVFRLIQFLNVESNSWETLTHEQASDDIAKRRDLGGDGSHQTHSGGLECEHSVGPF